MTGPKKEFFLCSGRQVKKWLQVWSQSRRDCKTQPVARGTLSCKISNAKNWDAKLPKLRWKSRFYG